MALTEQQKHFCREYLKDFNAAKAYRRAGYKEKSAHSNAFRQMKKPEVLAYLSVIAKKQLEKQELTAERVLDEMRRLSFSDIKDYYKWSESKKSYVLKSLEELTPDQTAAIAEYIPGKSYKLYNKDGALDKLAKYFKLYTEMEATVNNFVVMPTVKKNGIEIVLNVGKPAPDPLKKS